MEPVLKTTDIHYNSSDGRGIFNYRLKFDLIMPSEYPILKLQAFSYSTVFTDSCIGEATLNIKNTVMLLK